jgi:hypothetical protein
MEVQVLPLTLGESANVNHSLCFDAHFRERWLVRHRRDDQRARIFEPDEAYSSRRQPEYRFKVDPSASARAVTSMPCGLLVCCLVEFGELA